MDLSSHCVPTAKEEVFYIPDFVNTEEEEYLLRKISQSSSITWKSLPGRRLQIWGGELTSSNTLLQRELPTFITNYPDIIPRLRATGVFSSSKHGQPNHVIVNEYLPGQGIMPHEDGPTYHPVVATLSLGSHAVFHYHQYLPERDHDSNAYTRATAVGAIDPNPVLSLLLEPRSLVITTKALYTHHLHSIEPVTHDILGPVEHDHDESCDSDSPRINNSSHGVKVANWKLLTNEEASRAALKGGTLERKTRVSLTCRDVERVVGGNLMGKAFAKR